MDKDRSSILCFSPMTFNPPNARGALVISGGDLPVAELASDRNFDEGIGGAIGKGFMREIDIALSGRLGISLIEMSLGSEKSSSSNLRDARTRLADVIVKDLSTVIPAREPVVGGTRLLRPKHGKHVLEPLDNRSLHRFGKNACATFRRDAAVVPNTIYRKIPGVVPGMNRKRV